MRTIITLLLLCCGLTTMGQLVLPVDSSSGHISINSVYYSYGDSAKVLFKKAQLFCQTDKEKFFKSNGEHNVGWEAFGGVHKANGKGDIANATYDIGFESADPETQTVIAHLCLRHEGGMIGGTGLLLIKADVILVCKDRRSRIEITNFTYTHYNLSTGKVTPVMAKGFSSDAGPCKSAGTLEDLSKCEHYEEGLHKVSAFIRQACNELMWRYKDFIVKPLPGKGGGNW